MSKLDIGRVRGSLWYTGTVMTGTGETTFPASNITQAYAEDYYLNTNTRNVYRCTKPGNPSTAVWKYVGTVDFQFNFSLEPISSQNGNSTSYGVVMKLNGNEVARAAEIYKKDYSVSVDSTGHAVLTY